MEHYSGGCEQQLCAVSTPPLFKGEAKEKLGLGMCSEAGPGGSGLDLLLQGM